MALEDYGALLQSGANSVQNYQNSLAMQVGLDTARLQQQHVREIIADAQVKRQRQQSFIEDMKGVGSNPSAQGIAGLVMKYPEFADQLKAGWDIKDKAARQADVTSLGEIYSAAAAGNWDLAAKQARRRLEADQAAGQADPEDQAFVDALESGDDTKRKAALTTMGLHLAAASGPEHFASVYGALNPKPDFLVVPEGGKAIPLNSTAAAVGGASATTGGGGPGSSVAGGGGGSVSPAASSVASVLSTGLPAPVVAGFMGNFHVEGGYDGAKGDGGSASGIGQWHNDRLANFEKVVGKPVDQATPAEQAQYVLWEMQHPEQAGMTVKQRDAIMNAKTPAQAAALIDQFYERSDGKARQGRMQAATAFAGDTSSQSATTSAAPAQVRPGDPTGTVYGNPKPQARVLTSAEAKAKGLDTAKVYEEHPDGTVSAIGDSSDRGGIDPQELEDAATQYLLTGQMPALGNGGAGLKQQILARRSAIMKRIGIKAEELPAFQARYKADQAALQQNQALLSGLDSSEGALKLNGQQVWNTHMQLVKDGIIADNPWLTRQRLKYYNQFGDPDQRAHVKAYLDAVNAYTQEYTKFMTAANGMGGSAAPSDSAREHAGELNDPGLAATPLLAHLRQGLTEAANRRAGVAAQNQALQQKLSSYLHPYSGGGASHSAYQVNIPAAAVQLLKSNPTPQMRQFFDQKYGPGKAKQILGGR